MFAPMSPMTERVRIHNERLLNEARHETPYSLPKSIRLAALIQRLALRRLAPQVRQAEPNPCPQPCPEAL